MIKKVYNECQNVLGSADVEETVCPWPSEPSMATPPLTSAPHFFASDTPGDNETCQCGRFFYIAAKNMTGQ